MKRVAIYGWAATALALVFAAGLASAWLMQPKLRVLTQDDIDQAVLHTLQTQSLPSRAARVADAVHASVVEIRGYPDDDRPDASRTPRPSDPKAGPDSAPKPDDPSGQTRPDGVAPDRQADAKPPDGSQPDARTPTPGQPDATPKGNGPGNPPDGKRPDAQMPGAPQPDGKAPENRHVSVNIGSGVVVTDKGIILTNYHVIAGARRLRVTFYDGHESEASVVGVQPEKDLAVIRAFSLPDDLPAATLGSSRDLAPGDEVVAVGFPFGVGPSVSAGVVSGLDREFVSPDNKQDLDHLIQFDAAANPGNSGGPLVNMDGEVVGIVTAILNPTQSKTFIGIGFATTIESAGGAVGISPF
ncbi:S1C family serine protease [Bordetella genomosp. 9]|uniref:Serine protease n=1 Tax=Bordetella genomosp. 9 TaxID=1416803 RepID=A0A1W6YZJ2_9BORD|nr:trypsin-like peptidase domain-containing protein [Bordetella genomosp. 9]ARP86532.1 serine protease [Bordetella genomosp. 9]